MSTAPAVNIDSILPTQVLRNLSDRSAEKRKAAALELEKHMKRLKDTSQTAAIRTVLQVLSAEFASNLNANTRKGGLLALSGCAVALAEEAATYTDLFLPAVLRSFNDADNRIRFYACESAFNIVRIIRMASFQYLSELFTGICKLVADSDVEVKNGASMLDRLAKEIVCELGHIDCDSFIPLLRSHMSIVNPYVRQCLVGWVTTLDSVPGIDLVDYMPDLLEGLFNMLSDVNRDIRQQAYQALSNFLDQISKVPTTEFETRVAFRPMVDTLISQTAREKDKFNRLTGVEWLTQFILLGKGRLAPVYDRLLDAVLRCLSDSEPEIVSQAAKTNNELILLVRSTSASDFKDAFPEILRIVTREAKANDLITRSAALRWVAMLLAASPDRVMSGVDELLQTLLANLLDSEDSEVMRLNLEVLARLSVYNLDFLRTRILRDLLKLFADNRTLLEAKAAFIIRRLCLMLEPQNIYMPLAALLLEQPNREFASLVVELLHLILLTAIELAELRDLLRGCASSYYDAAAVVTSGTPSDGIQMFHTLYKTWCINPVASFSLCLLAQAYELGARIINKFAETTISVGVLMQVDKLVQLLETPIFLSTRLHLTQPERSDHQYLLRSLYGLLMIMPQGTAFATLRDRLHSVSALHVAVGSGALTSLPAPPIAAYTKSFDVDAAFSMFTDAQQRQRNALAADLRSRSLLLKYAQQLQQQAIETAALDHTASSAILSPTITATTSTTTTTTPKLAAASKGAVAVVDGDAL